MNGNFNQYINNCDNLDEEISVTEFIKTLKKVESSDTLNARDSGSSTSSIDKIPKAGDEKKIDKKASGNDLIQNMRKRFVHRATEPIFHALPEAQERRSSDRTDTNGDRKWENNERGKQFENFLNMPSYDTTLDRKTDSEPTLSRSNKYHVI